MADYCPNLSGDPAVLFASGGYNTFMNLAPRAYEAAVQQANGLNGFVISPIDFNASFDFDQELAAFQRPGRPVIDFGRFDFHAPTTVPDAPTFVGQIPTITEKPDADLTPPALSYGPKPITPDVAVPIPLPRPDPLIVPDAPSYTLPPLPSFIQLNLPAVPAIVIPPFGGERPVFIEPNIPDDFNFVPERYTSALKDKLVAKMSAWMDGQGMLPDAIEEALFARGRARIEVETNREIASAVSDWANRGFTEPGGVVNSRILQARQTAMDKKHEFNRDVTIKQQQDVLDNIRFATQQGIALEQVASNVHLEEQRMLLAAAQFGRETAIALINVRVSVFNAKMQAYAIDAEVFRARIQAALAQVELYRAQIEGEKLKGDINEQRVRIYAEQVRALNVLADFYRAQVEGVKAKADVYRAQIEGFKAEVDAYGSRWDAFAKEYDGYKASIEAENTKASVHRNLVDAFSTRIGAWATENNLRFDGERLRIAQHGQNMQAWRGLLDRMLGLVQAETSRIGAVAQGVDAQARMYQADATVESAASAATDRSFQLGLAKEQAEVDTALKAAEIRIQQNIQLTQIMVEVRKTLSQVMSQLAAAAMSAMNFSANVSSSRSDSRSCNTSYSWSGEAPDLT